MAKTVVATFNNLNKTVDSQDLLRVLQLDPDPDHRASHHHIEAVEGILTICSGLRTISGEYLKIRATRIVMQDRATRHLRQHLHCRSSSPKKKNHHKTMRMIILSGHQKN